MTSVSIFGATGSIGRSALDIISKNPQFTVDVLTAYNNAEKLIELAKKYQPKHVVIGNDAYYQIVKEALPDVIVSAGKEAINEAAAHDVDILLNAVIGAAGLPVSLASLNCAKRLALANKESLVAGGDIFMNAVQASATELIPVDSEHNAIFQSLLGQDRNAISHIILTASGGPFREYSEEALQSVTLGDALKHPNWNMGARITVDSASMFNKALEMIEAKVLFDLKPHEIEVLIHKESILHSAVAFKDGGVMAEMGLPDMRHAIAFALSYPKRLTLDIEPLSLAKLANLSFEAPDEKRFPALRLARMVMEKGGLYGAALNAAKEIALDRFFAQEINFTDMAKIVETVLLDPYFDQTPIAVEEIFLADKRARELAKLWR